MSPWRREVDPGGKKKAHLFDRSLVYVFGDDEREAGSGEDLRGCGCRLCHLSIRKESEGRLGRAQKIAGDGLSNAPTQSGSHIVFGYVVLH